MINVLLSASRMKWVTTRTIKQAIALIAIFSSLLLLPGVRAADDITPVASGMNPFLTQQSRFTNVRYDIYPSGSSFDVQELTQGNIKAGPLLVHPHFGVAENYTDNVTRTDPNFGGRISDWYTTYQPGMQIQLPIMGRHKIIMDYRAYLERYSKDATLDVNDQTMSLNPVFVFPGGLTIKLLGELKDGHDYRGSATSNLVGVGTTGSSSINQFYNTEYGGEIELKSQTYVRAQSKYIRYQFTGPLAGSREPGTAGDINTRNRMERYDSLALGGRVAPNTYVYVKGMYQSEQYEVNKDLDSHILTFAGGSTWEGLAKSTGSFDIGYQARTMDQASTTRGNGAFSTIYFNGNFLWTPQEQTKVNLSFYRRTSETVLAQTRFYTATGTTFDVVHALTGKWNVTGQVMYEHDKYSNSSTADNMTDVRQDDFLSLGGGLWYQIQPWLGARLAYLHAQRLSNFISVEYNANQTMVSLQAQF
jgi:hypothetical protein